MCLGHRQGIPSLSIRLFCVLRLSHFPLMKPLLSLSEAWMGQG